MSASFARSVLVSASDFPAHGASPQRVGLVGWVVGLVVTVHLAALALLWWGGADPSPLVTSTTPSASFVEAQLIDPTPGAAKAQSVPLQAAPPVAKSVARPAEASAPVPAQAKTPPPSPEPTPREVQARDPLREPMAEPNTANSAAAGSASAASNAANASVGSSASASTEVAPAPASIPPDYLSELFRKLARHKVYPSELRKDKVQGRVVVKFTISQDGRLLTSSVQKSSGSSALDDAALSMLQKASPLPSIPKSMNRSELTLAVPVEYSLITDR